MTLKRDADSSRLKSLSILDIAEIALFFTMLQYQAYI